MDNLIDILRDYKNKEFEKQKRGLEKEIDDILIQYNELSYFTDQLINYAKTKDIFTEDFIKDKDPRRRFRDVRLHKEG